MPAIGKIVAGIATASALGGVTIGSYFALNSSQNISGRLTEEGFFVLDISKTHSEDWTAVLNAYKQEKTNTFTGKEDKEVNEAYLQNKCKVALSSKSDNSNNYKLAKRWCVKEESINTFLKRKGYTILSTEDDKANENKIWKQKIEELLKDTSKFPVAQLVKETRNDVADIKAFKVGCKTLKTDSTKTTSEDFEKGLELTKEWCAVKSNVD